MPRKKKEPEARYTLLVFDPQYGGIVGISGRLGGHVQYMTTAEWRAVPERLQDDFIEVEAEDIVLGKYKACGCFVSTDWNMRVYARFEVSDQLWRVEVGEAVGHRKYNRVGMDD